MCAITGALALTGPVNGLDITHTLTNALERGRDSAGIYVDGITHRTTTTGTGLPLLALDARTVVLANNRGEPTTEWQEHKRTEDVQPYTHQGPDQTIHVLHNGTIANDKAIAAELHTPAPPIDSQIIGEVLLHGGPLTPDNFSDRLSELVGSYALAVYDEGPRHLYLAANYKPLYLELIEGAVYFASLPHHLPGHGTFANTITKVEPYTYLVFESGTPTPIARGTLRAQQDDSVLVVASGGMDSTVVAAQAVAEGKDVTLLHVDYSCRAATREIEAVHAIADRLGVPLVFVETDLFTNTIKASRLTGTHEAIAGGEAGAELAIEWVPARNLILSAIAVGIAEARGISTIALGNNLEESGAYPDNEQEFIHQLNHVLPNAVNVDRHVTFTQPVGNLMKHEIVALGLAVDAPLDLTWSCYEGGTTHCGDCGPCYMRRTAFAMNHATDPIRYQEPAL